ncbi:hypothetical protein BC828DRAFT_392013, partial [Blastocladiella britannica]
PLAGRQPSDSRPTTPSPPSPPSTEAAALTLVQSVPPPPPLSPQSLNAFSDWSLAATDPRAFLVRYSRAAACHPALATVPALLMVRADAHLRLGSLSHALALLREADRLAALDRDPPIPIPALVKDNSAATMSAWPTLVMRLLALEPEAVARGYPNELAGIWLRPVAHASRFLARRISAVALALAVAARSDERDPWRCIRLLNLRLIVSVTMQTAHALLDLGQAEPALAVLMVLANQTADAQILLVCARLFVQLGNLPAVFTLLSRMQSLGFSHPGMSELSQLLDHRVQGIHVECAQLAADERCDALLDLALEGLLLAPTDSLLLYFKAEALLGQHRPADLLQFLDTCPAIMQAESKHREFKCTALELLVRDAWNHAKYDAALTYLATLKAARAPSVDPRDGLWFGLLRQLAHGDTDHQALVALEAFRTASSAGAEISYDQGVAEAQLCIGYAASARKLDKKGAAREWRAALKLYEKALALSWPRVPSLTAAVTVDGELAPFPGLLNQYPGAAAGQLSSTWVARIPTEARPGRLWYAISRLHGRLGDSARAAAAARAALVMVPDLLDAKAWLLELTGDQRELAELAAAVLDRRWGAGDPAHATAQPGVAVASVPAVPESRKGSAEGARDGGTDGLLPPVLCGQRVPVAADMVAAARAARAVVPTRSDRGAVAGRMRTPPPQQQPDPTDTITAALAAGAVASMAIHGRLGPGSTSDRSATGASGANAGGALGKLRERRQPPPGQSRPAPKGRK